MSILTIKSVSLSIVDQQLFDAVNLQVQERDKIALIGRNGEGKSTLLKLMAGLIMPDRGEIIKSPQCKVALLQQQVPHAEQGKVFDIIVAGIGGIGDLLKRYNQCLVDDDQELLTSLAEKIEAQDGWSVSSRVNTIISKVGLKPEARIEDLSGGMKRRVMLAIALANEPDLLLLDEPTNHLDIASIEWLETFLQQYRGAFVLVTHDRAFLSKVANRIVEIDRAQIHSYPGDYTNYLQRKEQRLQEEERHNALFDKRLSEEEKWIRQGIKARRTRNEGRVRALKEMRRQRQQRVEQRGVMSGVSVGSQQSGKVVIEANNTSYAYEEKKIIDDFSLLLMRGDKVGIVGPNGCGKTTLLKLLLNQLQPSQGEIKFGTKLEVAYFDQLRSQLDENMTVLENVAEGRNEVTVNGKSKHVVSYLQDFLFSPQRINQPIAKLSGGERNRLLLAKLLTKEVNVLVMDEPTNDLDIEALEMLEAMLVDFNGTLLIVSHDRQFLNNVATSLLVYDGRHFEEHLGGYDDYIQAKPKTIKQPPVATSVARKVTKKLSYNEQRELQQIPLKMEKLEQEVESLQEIMTEPSFYKKTQQEILEVQKQLDEKEQQLNEYMERWEELESRNA